MTYWPLLGVLVVVVGFMLRWNPVAVVVGAALTSGLAAGKLVMKLIGLDCGPVRLPLRRLTSADETSFRGKLDACGFFSYASRT